jgi:hypothetical protein
MKANPFKLPEMKARTLYQFTAPAGDPMFGTTTSQNTDPTTTCTTILTTTHFDQR